MKQPRIGLLTREYPPEIYGGAGVHVEYLARELRRHVELSVHCFGAPRPQHQEVAKTYVPWEELSGSAPHMAALRTLSVDLAMAAAVSDLELVHSHTWYANFAGYLAKLLYGIPHVMTSHSLEPLRPWKAEQLGGGYALSSYCERVAIEAADAVIAVSSGMKRDILKAYPNVREDRVAIIYNGIDPAEYKPDPRTDVLERHGIPLDRPYVVFVGRITRQKGVVHLLEAAAMLTKGASLVLCAGEADTKELAEEVKQLAKPLASEPGRLIWIDKMLPRPELIQILSHARVFVCPSVYEPFGIVNLEAMACGAPVVASAVGGIPEIVVQGDTGFLVPFEPDGTPAGTPKDRALFARQLADKLNLLLEDAGLARRLGDAGRRRVAQKFSWASIAERTSDLYRSLIERAAAERGVPAPSA